LSTAPQQRSNAPGILAEVADGPQADARHVVITCANGQIYTVVRTNRTSDGEDIVVVTRFNKLTKSFDPI
jgi:hypothetical protein